jgi:hypothetical protein
MGAVIDAAVPRFEGARDLESLLHLGQAAHQALRQRHLLVYLRDEAAAALLAEEGWDGALHQGPGDYLMVVDTNVGFNKVNGLVKERLTYTVDLRNSNRPQAALVVQHEHPLRDWLGPCDQRPRYGETYRQMIERCYWDYLRIYVSSGTELSDATPHAVPGQALLSGEPNPPEVTVQDVPTGHRVLGTLLLLRPGQTLDTRFEYVLAQGTLQSEGRLCRYNLTVQKQPGTGATALRVRVLLPPGAAIKASHPTPDSSLEPGPEYALTLATDQRISLTYECSGS